MKIGNYITHNTTPFSYEEECSILYKYFNITEIPCVISSPLRVDKSPSLSFYISNNHINVKDFSTGESWSLTYFMSEYLNLSLKDTIIKLKELNNDYEYFYTKAAGKIPKIVSKKDKSDIKIKTREWNNKDIEYWDSFGISVSLLRMANVTPISHIFFIKDNNSSYMVADSLAYAFIHYGEEKPLFKIYQPYNKKYKWFSNYNSSIISLNHLLPKTSDNLFICSSLKDALCLKSQLGYNSIAPQGEGYRFSEEYIDNLKSRFKNIYILFDNDEAGIVNTNRLAKETGFIPLYLPNINNTKDISDLYKSLNNKSEFKNIINNLINK